MMGMLRIFRAAVAQEDRKAREDREAAQRWRESNARARAAGCKCGRPATHVRRYGGTVGGVPHEVWTCEEHRLVNAWQRTGDGPWVPAGDVDAAAEAWRVG